PSAPTPHVTYTMVPGSETTASPSAGSFSKIWMVDHTSLNNCKPAITKIHDTGEVVTCLTVIKTVVANNKLNLNGNKIKVPTDLVLKPATWIIDIKDGAPPTPFGKKYEGSSSHTFFNKAKVTDKITTHFTLI